MGETMSQAPLYLVGGTSLFRRGLASFLEDDPFFVAGEFDDHRACVAAATPSSAPALIIYAASGEVEDSAAAVESLVTAFANARILVLSADLSVDELGACLKMGAAGYLLSSISREVLTHSLRLILLGETVFPSQLAAAWATGQLRKSERGDAKALENLTPRELDLLGCLTEGASNKLIARQLGITEATVKIHMKSLVRKIGVQNRTQAALWALQVGYTSEAVGLAA